MCVCVYEIHNDLAMIRQEFDSAKQPTSASESDKTKTTLLISMPASRCGFAMVHLKRPRPTSEQAINAMAPG